MRFPGDHNYRNGYMMTGVFYCGTTLTVMVVLLVGLLLSATLLKSRNSVSPVRNLQAILPKGLACELILRLAIQMVISILVLELDNRSSAQSKGSRNNCQEGHPGLCEANTTIKIKCSEKANRLKQSGIYYTPFGRKEPVLIRSVEAIQELCEAPQLSQAAVYGDVCVNYSDAGSVDF